MRNIVQPRTVSFEEALRNLASRLTGVEPAALPRTQEGIVQFMADNLPAAPAADVDVDALAEAITNEVLARLAAATPAPDAEEPAGAETPATGAEEPAQGTAEAEAPATPAAKEPKAAPAAKSKTKPKTTE